MKSPLCVTCAGSWKLRRRDPRPVDGISLQVVLFLLTFHSKFEGILKLAIHDLKLRDQTENAEIKVSSFV